MNDDSYTVHFPGGYSTTVLAGSDIEAREKALAKLVKHGLNINPKLDTTSGSIHVEKRSA